MPCILCTRPWVFCFGSCLPWLLCAPCAPVHLPMHHAHMCPMRRFFLNWYSTCLLRHGERLLSAASRVFRSPPPSKPTKGGSQLKVFMSGQGVAQQGAEGGGGGFAAVAALCSPSAVPSRGAVPGPGGGGANVFYSLGSGQHSGQWAAQIQQGQLGTVPEASALLAGMGQGAPTPVRTPTGSFTTQGGGAAPWITATATGDVPNFMLLPPDQAATAGVLVLPNSSDQVGMHASLLCTCFQELDFCMPTPFL